MFILNQELDLKIQTNNESSKTQKHEDFRSELNSTYVVLNGMKKRLIPKYLDVFSICARAPLIAFRALKEEVIRSMMSSTLCRGFVPSAPSFGEQASKRRKRPSGGKLRPVKDGAISSASSSTA